MSSTREVIGYHIEATDGELGHIADFLVDDYTWAIHCAIIDTNSWWLGKYVLIPSEWITDVSWPDPQLSVDLKRQDVKDAPEYDPKREIGDRWQRAYLVHVQQYGHFQTHATGSPGFVRLRERHECEVSKTDLDPRGWTVVSGTDSRTIGTVDDLMADPATMKVRYFAVDLDSNVPQDRRSNGHRHILLPVGYAQLSPGEGCVRAKGPLRQVLANLLDNAVKYTPPRGRIEIGSYE